MQKIGVLAEMALKRLNGGRISSDNQITFQEMVVAIGMARDHFLQIYFWENKARGEGDIDGAFIKSYDNIPVALNCEKKMYYSVLPSQVIGIANDMGVFQILYQEDQTTSFTRIPSGSYSLIANLDVGKALLKEKPFFKEGDKIYFPFMKASDGEKKVLMKLIPSSSSLEEDEYTYMVGEMEQRVVDYVVNSHLQEKQIPVDKVNDNSK